ncbi:hypothetical protein BDQ12DRAFT_678423 [Crucibulum laeve]|uniref:Uncharacterized protein n=1 Tax=Crucibulum laeve TaxID=68775 RepID=A0A5C3M8K0_9AGAR|nr:hypothetical protein BDQ12DRAFT_678423 [Crucibulum laeve]
MALSVSGFPEPSKTPTSPDPSPALDDGYKLMNSPRLRGFFGKKPDFGGGSGTIASGSGSTSKLPSGRDTFYADVDSSYVSSAPTNTPPSTPPIASYMPTFAQTSSDDDEYESYRQELLQQQQQQQQHRDQQQQQTVIMQAPIPLDSRAMVPITLPSHTSHKRPQPLPPIPRKANASPVRIQPSLTRLDIGARPTNAVKPGILKSSTTGPGGFVTSMKSSTIPVGTITLKSTSAIGGSKPALPMPPTVVVEEWSSSKSPASTNDGRSTPPRPLPAPPPKKEKEKFVNAVAGPSRLPVNAVAGPSGSSSSNTSAGPSSSTSYSQSATTSSTSKTNTSTPPTPSAAVTTTPTHRRTSSSGTSRPPSTSVTVPRARSTSNTRTRSTSRARAQRAAVRYQSMAMDHDGSSDTSSSSANMGNNSLRPLPAPPSAVLRTAPLPTPFITGVGASRYTSPPRSKRPRTSPTSNGLATGGPSNSRTPFDAIPISWASRPIDLNPAQQKQPPHSAGIMSGGRTQPAHPQGQRTRSQSRTRREVSLETPRSRYGSIGGSGGNGSGREQSTERSGYASAGPSTSASTLAANSPQAGYGTPPRVSQLHMGRPQIRAAPLISVTGKSLPVFQRPGTVVGGRPKRSATLDSAIVPSLTTTGIGPGGGKESAGTSAGSASASSSSIATPSSAGTGYGGGGAGRMGIHIQTSNITLPVGPGSDASTKGNTPISRPLPRSPRVRAETAPSPITYRPAGIIVSPTEEEAKALDLSAPLHSHPLESFSDEDSLAPPMDTNSSVGSPIEVFIDDQDMTSFSRSPSPMRYARPSSRGSVEDFEDELDEPMFDVDAGYRRDSRSNSRSRSPRRRTRTQPRSYRNSYRLPPRTPERSPSPIHYARRTSLERDDLSPTAEDPEMGLGGAKGKRWTQPRSFQFDYSASTSASASASANPSPPRTRQSSPDRGRMQPLRRGSKGLVPDERQSRSRSPKRSARKFRSTGSVPAPMPKEEPFVLDISLHQTMVSKSERNSLRISGSGKEKKRRDEAGRPGTAESNNSLGTSSTGSGSGRRSVAYPLPTTAPLPLTPHRRVASVAIPATERFDLDDTHGASCGIGIQRRADDGDYKDYTRVGTPNGGLAKPKKDKEKERGRNKERGKADDVEMDFLEGLYSSLRKKDKKDKDEAVVWGTSRDLGEDDNRWLDLGDREALVVTTTIQSSANEMWEEEGVTEVIPKLRSLKVRHGR